MDNKKYYYLKLKENFYDSEEMIVLQNMQDGYLFSDILMKLYLRSLKNNGKLMFKDMIPYTPTAMAQVVRHQVGTVERGLKIFKELGLIEILDNGAIYLLDIQNFIGKSSTEADRQRGYYEKIMHDKKKLCKKSCKKPYKKPTPEIELEIELKKEIDLEIEKDNKQIVAKKPATLLPQQEVYNYFSEKYKNLTNEKYLSKTKDFVLLTKLAKDFGVEKVKEKIDWLEVGCVNSVFWFSQDKNDFTIGKLYQFWNEILPRLTEEQKKEQEKQKIKEKMLKDLEERKAKGWDK